MSSLLAAHVDSRRRNEYVMAASTLVCTFAVHFVSHSGERGLCGVPIADEEIVVESEAVFYTWNDIFPMDEVCSQCALLLLENCRSAE
jgi:hypothetical protein